MVRVPGDLLFVRGDGDPAVALADSPEEFGNNVLFRREIGVRGPARARALGRRGGAGLRAPEGTVSRDLRGVFSGMAEDFFRMAGRAKQIVGWNATHPFCGRCGARPGPCR